MRNGKEGRISITRSNNNNHAHKTKSENNNKNHNLSLKKNNSRRGLGSGHIPFSVLCSLPPAGLLLAEAQIRMSGLQVPGFPTLTFVSRKVLPIYGRRLEELSSEEQEEYENLAQLEKDLNEKWDPKNHPKMKALREAMRELLSVRNEFTKIDGEPAQNLTRANIEEKLHLIEPALKKSVLDQDTCQ